jgi:hypothetical protein
MRSLALKLVALSPLATLKSLAAPWHEIGNLAANHKSATSLAPKNPFRSISLAGT